MFFYYQQYCAKRERLLFVVQGECPVLANIGFPKIMSAEQCYQNIAFYIANNLTQREQPPNMSDTEKVVLIERQGGSFEVTVKRDGSSCTAYVFDGEIGVCSRNINLKEVEGNGFWDVVKKNDIHTKIIQTGRNLAVQGELIAPNIQGNYEKVVKPEFHCFSIFDIDRQEYLLPQERRSICNTVGIQHIKVLDENFILKHSCDDLLAYAEGDGVNSGVKREGVVFKSNTDQFSFKAVSNSYLLKKG